MRSAAILFGIGLAFGGCGDARETDAPGARDSAGISIVAIGDPAAGAEWTLSPEPTMALGSMDAGEAYELYQAMFAFRLDDGRIVVANQGTEELRFYGPGGEHLRTVGRKGGGPGEFEDMWGMTRLPGDSLGVWDWTAKRLTVYDDEGNFGRIVTPTAVEGFVPRLVGAFDDGSFVYRAGFNPTTIFQAGGGLRDDSVSLVRASLADGAVLDTLGPYPADITFVEMSESGFWTRQVPFGRREHVAVRGDGVWVGDDRAGEVRVYDATGRLVRITRLPHSPAPVTQDDIDRYRERTLEEVEAGRLAEERRRLDQLPAAETLPAFTSLGVDRLGRTWLRLYGSDESTPAAWVILNPDGELAARINMPYGAQPLDAGTDYVLLYWRDELDVEHIGLYDLRAAPTG